jgi:hypothetical protein
MSSEHTPVGLDAAAVADVFTNGSTYTRSFNWEENGDTTLAVVEAVSTVLDVDPTEVTPLNEVIDTDALNALFTSTATDVRRTGHIQFVYEDCLVRVKANGTVSAAPVPAE